MGSLSARLAAVDPADARLAARRMPASAGITGDRNRLMFVTALFNLVTPRNCIGFMHKA
jgi:hypothetical protein